MQVGGHHGVGGLLVAEETAANQVFEQRRIDGGDLGFRNLFPQQALAYSGPFGGQADRIPRVHVADHGNASEIERDHLVTEPHEASSRHPIRSPSLKGQAADTHPSSTVIL